MIAQLLRQHGQSRDGINIYVNIVHDLEAQLFHGAYVFVSDRGLLGLKGAYDVQSDLFEKQGQDFLPVIVPGSELRDGAGEVRCDLIISDDSLGAQPALCGDPLKRPFQLRA